MRLWYQIGYTYPMLIAFGAFSILAVTAAIEYGLGRTFLGPNGFGIWSGDIWSIDNSQLIADAYSFSHVIHGMIFYWFLWLIARKLPLRYRFLAALLIEAAWEILENSPLIINRYREATIALGYVGDSIMNSLADIMMTAIGFEVARRYSVRVTVALILIMEIGCLIWIRDNLALNVLMLVHPVEAVKVWQSVGRSI